jgi:hypothetical protein
MLNVQLPSEEEDFISKTFPLETIPPKMQYIIKSYVKCLNLNPDYSAAIILFAFASAIGGSRALRIRRSWIERPCLFMAIVGHTGINKSGVLSIFTKPLEDFDKMLYDSYADEQKKFKKDKSNKDEGTSINIEEPIRRQVVLKDSTLEAANMVLFNNPRGVACITDELIGYLKNFTRYRSGGGDEEALLSLFSGKSISINRKNSEQLLITNPFFNLIGGIQPDILASVFSNKIDNGLTHRFLYVFPDNVKREALSDDDISEETEELYASIITSVLNSTDILLGKYTYRELSYSDEAELVYKKWRMRNDEIINSSTSGAVKGIYSKLDVYFHRMSLILHLLWLACNEHLSKDEDTKVSGISAERAVKVMAYFESSALKTSKLFDKFRDPLIQYPYEHKKFYYRLPNIFSTDQAKQIANGIFCEKTMYNILKDSYLFKKLLHGIYEKLW